MITSHRSHDLRLIRTLLWNQLAEATLFLAFIDATRGRSFGGVCGVSDTERKFYGFHPGKLKENV